MLRIKKVSAVLGVLVITAAVWSCSPLQTVLQQPLPGPASAYSVEDRVGQYGAIVAARLAPAFAAAGVAYPPHDIAYLAFKDQRVLEVYARGAADGPWRYIKSYSVLAASGLPGPKLREGDRQVPEGIYRAEWLNPNSRFHLSIRLDYPNDFDRRMAALDQRDTLGGDIMIHGNQVSIGCLAIGDEAAEDLFILAAVATPERTRIVVSPNDFRKPGVARPVTASAWTGQLYEQLQSELGQFPRALPL